jgi:hypothetical protein
MRRSARMPPVFRAKCNCPSQLRLAGGGAVAEAEAACMVTEKIVAAREAQVAVATAVMLGRKGHVVAGKALGAYGKRVRAHKRRLSGDRNFGRLVKVD